MRAHHYYATVTPGLDRVVVRACFDGVGASSALKLVADPDLVRFAHDLRVSRFGVGVASAPTNIEFAGNVLVLPTQASCLTYWVDLDAAAAAGSGMRRSAARVGADMKTNADLWLLKPQLTRSDRIDLWVSLPAGVQMSAPWSRPSTGLTGTGGESEQRFEIVRSPSSSWGAVVAFGRFQPQLITLPDGARLEVSVLDGTPKPDASMLARWIDATARQVLQVHGRFPVRTLQVLLVPLLTSDLRPTPVAARHAHVPGRTLESVGFGRIIRDGGTAAELQIVQTASPAALRADWTASHELSHLLLPLLAEPGGWISEGFADYYQNLLMARAGEYTEAEAWRRLLAGFERGRGDGHYTDSLEEVLQRNGENALMRRYWTGAIVALLVDVDLRVHSAGRASLDTLLGKLTRCCLPAQDSWTRAQLFTRLDALAGRKVFTGVHEVWEQTSAYPDYQSVLQQLGVVGNGRGVQLNDSAPLAAVRRAIMQPRSRGQGAQNSAGTP